jgi:hypothetical protein
MTITIHGELCDLNTYIRAERSNRFRASKIKQEETERVAWETAGLGTITSYPVHITYTWYSKDNRMDIDNVAFAVKFIHDGLVEAGVLDGDGRKHIAGFSHAAFLIDKTNPRVELTIEPSCPQVKDEGSVNEMVD